MDDTRRGHREDSIYFDHRVGTACVDARLHKACAGRWRGVASLGFAADGRRRSAGSVNDRFLRMSRYGARCVRTLGYRPVR